MDCLCEHVCLVSLRGSRELSRFLTPRLFVFCGPFVNSFACCLVVLPTGGHHARRRAVHPGGRPRSGEYWVERGQPETPFVCVSGRVTVFARFLARCGRGSIHQSVQRVGFHFNSNGAGCCICKQEFGIEASESGSTAVFITKLPTSCL